MVVLVTIAAGSSIAGALGALYRYRVRHRPGASVALTVSEILPKGNHVFIRVSDGADPYWLSVTRPSAYTNEKPWHRYVRETLDLAGQPLQGGEAIRVANGTDSAGPQESSTPPGP